VKAGQGFSEFSTSGCPKLKAVFADNSGMDERRAEARMLCADMVTVRWNDAAGHPHEDTALLEDIAPHGACLQVERALPLNTEIALVHVKARMRGAVRYCVYREIGYFVGVQFTADSEWSRSKFTPQHLLDLEQLVMQSARKALKREKS
jgi:hypothetical protein